MKGETHLVTGAAVGLALARVSGAPFPGALLLAGAAGLGSLVPDWVQVNIPALGKTIKGAFGHRGFSHWGLTVAGVYILASGWRPDLALALALGWASHLLLDALNPPGVPLFWPLPWRLRLARFKSDGWGNQAVAWVAVALLLWGAVVLL